MTSLGSPHVLGARLGRTCGGPNKIDRIDRHWGLVERLSFRYLSTATVMAKHTNRIPNTIPMVVDTSLSSLPALSVYAQMRSDVGVASVRTCSLVAQAVIGRHFLVAASE